MTNYLVLGIVLFIFREIIFFAGWFWAFFHNRLIPSREIGRVWPPFYLICLEPFQVPLLNTIVLLRRGVTVTVAHYIIINNKNRIFFFFSTIECY